MLQALDCCTLSINYRAIVRTAPESDSPLVNGRCHPGALRPRSERTASDADECNGVTLSVAGR